MSDSKQPPTTAYTDIVIQHLPSSIPQYTREQNVHYQEKIKSLLVEQNAVLIAHYYTNPEIQSLAEETGGFVGDSLAMAQFGKSHKAQTLIIAGVKFMGETAKILCPEKKVLMPTLDATCSLDLTCPIDEFAPFCDQHSDRTVVVYTNTSAAVKARADWVVTSSIGLPIIEHLHAQGKKILWASDRYLGSYLKNKTGADMLLWNGACIVHEEFKAASIRELQKQHLNSAVLVHPESPEAVIELAHVVGSTSQLLGAVTSLPHDTFIVATEEGIFYKMKQAAPEKKFILAPTGGKGATCRSCGRCPWMKMNNLQNMAESLERQDNEIIIDETIRKQALLSVQRMMDFAEQHGV